jgi:hypothetical protein
MNQSVRTRTGTGSTLIIAIDVAPFRACRSRPDAGRWGCLRNVCSSGPDTGRTPVDVKPSRSSGSSCTVCTRSAVPPSIRAASPLMHPRASPENPADPRAQDAQVDRRRSAGAVVGRDLPRRRRRPRCRASSLSPSPSRSVQPDPPPGPAPTQVAMRPDRGPRPRRRPDSTGVPARSSGPARTGPDAGPGRRARVNVRTP